MHESIEIPETSNRRIIYASLIPQLKTLISGENNFIANTANIVAALKQSFQFLWIGCYFVDSDEELVLGPFQGPVACTRIKKGRGVCGTSWLKNESIVVPDVTLFAGHIACSSFSKSEIVIPIKKANGSVIGVLDIDSSTINDFDQLDVEYLEQIAQLIGGCAIG